MAKTKDRPTKPQANRPSGNSIISMSTLSFFSTPSSDFCGSQRYFTLGRTNDCRLPEVLLEIIMQTVFMQTVFINTTVALRQLVHSMLFFCRMVQERRNGGRIGCIHIQFTSSHRFMHFFPFGVVLLHPSYVRQDQYASSNCACHTPKHNGKILRFIVALPH
jgi:hypothetical protein